MTPLDYVAIGVLIAYAALMAARLFAASEQIDSARIQQPEQPLPDLDC
jgi:hypothetical protein